MEFCRYEKKDRVARITITRPEVMNSLHVYANHELNEVWDDFANDDDLWVAVLTGEGSRAFSAGNDLKFTAEVSRLPSSERPRMGWASGGFGGLTSRFDLYKPTIARVNGYALGGGFEMALACDIVVAAEHARFGLTEPKVGLIAGANGVGRIDMVEDRLVGIKSREVYEAPAATTLRIAHQALETLTLSKSQIRLKHRLMQDYADLIYDGLWYTAVHQDLATFTASMQRHVSGTARLKLYKGQAVAVGVESPNSLYQYSLATYDEGDVYDQTSAVGFIDIFGLPVRVQAQQQLLKQPGGVLDVSSGRSS